MINLLKYEFKKRKTTIIVGAIVLSAMECLALYLVNKDNIILATLLMFAMLITAIMMAFFDVATQYYNDFKKAQGTLLFLTPNKGNKIVGSKMIFGALELISGLLIVLLFAYITNSAVIKMGYEGAGPIIQQNISMLDISFGESNTWWIMTGFIFLVFLQYFTGQAVAILSITLGRTILSRNSYNWLWAVLLFIGTNIAIQTVNSIVLLVVGLGEGWFKEILMYGNVVNATIDISKFLIIGGAEYLIWTVIAFFASSVMLNKKVDI